MTNLIGREPQTPEERDYRRAMLELENVHPEVLRLAAQIQKFFSERRMQIKDFEIKGFSLVLPDNLPTLGYIRSGCMRAEMFAVFQATDESE
jgi:hypothetical protein